MNGNMAGTDSDSEDPLYSKVNRRVPVPRRLSPINDNGDEEASESANGAERISKSLPKHATKTFQGVENKGYIGEYTEPI